MTKTARYLFGNELAETISVRKFNERYWYTSVDICNLLGIENHSQAVHRTRESDNLTLSESEWRHETIFNGTSRRRMQMVNDNGMLKLIMQGTSPFALEVQERVRNIPQHLIPAGWQMELIKE